MSSKNIEILDSMLDRRINCHSIMLKMDVKEYLALIEKAYRDNGGIEGQRQPLKSKSAKRIRETMKNDIEQGTVLPALVIGCVVENLNEFQSCIDKTESKECEDAVYKILNENTLSIIDGMQRTTALKEVFQDLSSHSFPLRIELWVTDAANNLIYRMLVLNTGQISWGLKKQLEVVFSHVKKELTKEIKDIELLESNDSARATKPKKYQLSQLVELYLSFSTKKVDVNLNEKVTEEYAKQDVIENSYNQKHLPYFIGLIKYLVELDEIFFKDNGIEKRLFGDQNARLGFIAALATEIFGRPGSKKYTDEKIEQRYTDLSKQLSDFIAYLRGKEKEALNEFYDVEVLKELSSNCSKRQLSEYYQKAFKVLVEEKFDIDEIGTMEVCWRA